MLNTKLINAHAISKNHNKIYNKLIGSKLMLLQKWIIAYQKGSTLCEPVQLTNSPCPHSILHMLSIAITINHFSSAFTTFRCPSIFLSLTFWPPLFLTFVLNIIELLWCYFIILLLTLHIIVVEPRLQQNCLTSHNTYVVTHSTSALPRLQALIPGTKVSTRNSLNRFSSKHAVLWHYGPLSCVSALVLLNKHVVFVATLSFLSMLLHPYHHILLVTFDIENGFLVNYWSIPILNSCMWPYLIISVLIVISTTTIAWRAVTSARNLSMTLSLPQ